MSVFAKYAHKYIKNGIPVMPVIGKSQPLISDFTAYARDGMDEDLLDKLVDDHPDKNIGVLCGGKARLIGFDLDYDGPKADEYESMIRSMLPTIVVEKVGKKRFTVFYRGDLRSQKKEFTTGDNGSRKKVTCFEILSTGRYTIIPPSIHPDINRPYYWSKGSLLDIDIDLLPELTQVDIDALVMATDKFFGLNNEKKSSGRNNSIWGFAYRTAKKHNDYESWKNSLIEFDLKYHRNNPYFEDPAERGARTPAEFAEYMCKSWYKSIKPIYKKYYDVDFEFGTEVIEEFPEGGFYFDSNTNPLNPPRMKPSFRFAAEFYRDTGRYVFSDSFSYIYKDGYWKYLEVNSFNKIICDSSPKDWQPYHLDNFRKSIRALCDISGFNFEDEDGLLNLQNGVLNSKTGELLKHSPKYFFKGKLPISYNKDAACPRFIEFLHFVLNDDPGLILLVQKMIGYILIGGYPFLHKAFVLYGDGRNGKSTLLDVIRALIGKQNYSSIPLSSLHQKFSTVLLDGKIANIVSETPTDGINSEIFKTITSGEPIVVSRKNKDEYDLDVKARFIFACNSLPQFGESSTGIKDRLVMIPFNRYIEENERDTTLREKLDLELPGILNWALIGAKKVLEDRFIESPAVSVELKEEYTRQIDSVFAFYKDAILFDGTSQCTVGEIYQHYLKYCEECGRKPFGKDKMIKSFRRMYELDCKARGISFEKDFRFYMTYEIIEKSGKIRQETSKKRFRGFSCIALNKDFDVE